MALYSRHIDGHDYMYALSEMLESAREAIFILVSAIYDLTTQLNMFLSPNAGLVAHP